MGGGKREAQAGAAAPQAVLVSGLCSPAGQGLLQGVLHHVRPPAAPPAPSCLLKHHLIFSTLDMHPFLSQQPPRHPDPAAPSLPLVLDFPGSSAPELALLRLLGSTGLLLTQQL